APLNHPPEPSCARGYSLALILTRETRID
ncbi:hypothetical protein A2U01_0067481, partial [Trifolium medium]|nr:hypothetical protein [Trifolium medium]